MSGDDPSDDAWLDGEFDDFPDDAPAELLPCPECGADIYEEAEQCPICGSYVTFRTNVWADRSLAWVLVGLAGVVAFVVGLVWFG